MFRLIRLRSCSPYTLSGQVYDSLCIGRSGQNELRTEDRLISSAHARFVVRESGLFVVDLDSRNGTEVNGKRLDPFEPCQLRDTDVVDVAGRLSFRVRVEPGAPYPVITLEEPEDPVASPLGDNVIRVLSLPDGLTPVLDAGRLLSLTTLTRKLVDPTLQMDAAEWFARLTKGAARALQVPEVQLARLQDGHPEPIGEGKPTVSVREETLTECLRREASVAVEVAGLELRQAETASTFEVAESSPFVSTLCGLIKVHGVAWGVIYAEGSVKPRRAFDEQDVWLLANLCKLVGHLLPQLSWTATLQRHRPRIEALVAAAEDVGLVGRSHALALTLASVEAAAAHNGPVCLLAPSGSQPEPYIALLHRLSARSGFPTEVLSGERLSALDQRTSLDRLLASVDGGTLGISGFEGVTQAGQGRLADVMTSPWGQRVRFVVSMSLPVEQAVSLLDVDPRLVPLLGQCVVRVPGLRERPEDVPLLAQRLAHRMRPELTKPFSDDALEQLAQSEIEGDEAQLEGLVAKLLEGAADRPVTADQVLRLKLPRRRERGPESVDDPAELRLFGGEAPSVPLLPLAGDLVLGGLFRRER